MSQTSMLRLTARRIRSFRSDPLFVLLIFALLFLTVRTLSPGLSARLADLNGSSLSHPSHSRCDNELPERLPDSFGRFRGVKVAVIEQTRYHEEVIGGVLSSLHDMGVEYDFYRGSLGWGFDKILADIHPETPLPPRSIVEPIKNGVYALIVLVTCDAKFWKGWQEVLDPLQQSGGPHVVCLYHEIERFATPDDIEMLAPIALDGRLSLLGLGQHSATHLHKKLLKMAAETRDHRWERVSVSHFAPILRIPEAARLETPVVQPSPPGSPVSKAAILGRVQQESRDYSGIFSELLSSIKDDPALWGYRSTTVLSTASRPELDSDQAVNDVQQASRQRFVPLDGASESCFTLHLVGKDDGKVRIPEELADEEFPIVVGHSELQYDQFYDLVGAMDFILPAFSTYHYLDSRSSAAIPAAIIAQTRILASPLLLESYTYVDGPAMSLVPASLSPVAALALLRASKDPWEELSLERDTVISARSSVWQSPSLMPSELEWEAYRSQVELKNMETWASLLSRAVR